MIALFWNLMLAIVWVALTDSVSLYNFILGFLVGWAILALIQRHVPPLKGYSNRVSRIISFAVFFVKELVVANIRVAYDVLTPTSYMSPGVVGYKLDAKTDTEILFVSTFISLTPGTLSMDVSDDKKVLYIHAMFLEDKASFITDIQALERHVLRIMR